MEPRIEISVCDDGFSHYIYYVVNGYRPQLCIHVESIDQAKKIAPELQKILKDVYKTAYNDGISSCQLKFKEALGL